MFNNGNLVTSTKVLLKAASEFGSRKLLSQMVCDVNEKIPWVQYWLLARKKFNFAKIKSNIIQPLWARDKFYMNAQS